MKYKTTRKQLKHLEHKTIKVGYCDLANLLRYESPESYNSGVYGWNWDFYRLDGFNICTGYRSLFGQKVPWQLIKEYNELGRNATTQGETETILSAFLLRCTEFIK